MARWWGDPETRLRAVLERPVGVGDALIVADGVPVGYVRWQKAPRAELEADYPGAGIASRALPQVVEEFAADKSVPMIMMATSVDNATAIRAYENAGFRRVRRFQDPEYGVMWFFTSGYSTVQEIAPADRCYAAPAEFGCSGVSIPTLLP